MSVPPLGDYCACLRLVLQTFPAGENNSLWSLLYNLTVGIVQFVSLEPSYESLLLQQKIYQGVTDKIFIKCEKN
jgi:hypothetical protein